MWPKEYRDYKKDESLVKNRVEPGEGITGCEMHEINGWGNTLHVPHEAPAPIKKKKNGSKR